MIPVLKHILLPHQKDSRLAKEIKQNIWSDLEVRYTDSETLKVLNTCSFLDPRFRNRHLENKEETTIEITEECLTLIQSLHSESPTESQDHTASEPPPAKRLKGLAAVISQIQKGKQSESETTVDTDTSSTNSERD